MLSSPDYLVTPGDTYTLTYAMGNAGTEAHLVQYVIPVDSSYRMRISNLGIINARGKTFLQLKSEAEALVAKNYPLSGPQLMLTRPAVFKVFVKGEVAAAKEIQVNGLTRLSDLFAKNSENRFSSLSGLAELSSARDTSALETAAVAAAASRGNLLEVTSYRDIAVASMDGKTRICDLFKAEREGDLSQNPYLRPGDTVTFSRAKRQVTLKGAVIREGNYQLLEGENLKALIAYYGGDFSPLADRSRITLERYVNGPAPWGSAMTLSPEDLAGDFPLEDCDIVTVPEITGLKPVIFVEGAVSPLQSVTLQEEERGRNVTVMAAAASTGPSPSTRLTVTFNRGEDYAGLVRANRAWFSATSDTKNAYIIRGNVHIPLDLNAMLYDPSYRGVELMQENDVLIVPFRQYFVTVAGAVVKPGAYPYIPDRGWEYYVGLAGGFVREKNSFESVEILDINGNKMKKTDPITPETTITAKTNAFLYYFNLYAPPVLTVLSLITTALTIQVMTR